MGPGPGGHLESLSHLVSHDQGFIFPSKCRRKQGFYFLFTKRRVPCSPVAFWSLLVGPPSAHGIWSTHDAQSRAAGRWDLSPPWSHSGLSLLGLLVTGSQPQSECGLGRTQWSRRPTSRCVLCSVAGSVGDSHPPPRTLEQPGHVRRCPLRGFTEFTSRFLEGEGLTEAPSSAASSLWPHQQGVF